MIGLYHGRPVRTDNLNEFTKEELIFILSSYKQLSEKYELDDLTKDELINLAKEYLFDDPSSIWNI